MDHPADFSDAARRAVKAEAPPGRARLREELLAFRERHDLGAALHGAVCPPCWLVREGDLAWVGGRQAGLVPVELLRQELRRLGDLIAARLETFRDDPVAQELLEDWESRDELDRGELVAIATGFDKEGLARVFGSTEVAADQLLFEGASLHESPFVAVARMAAGDISPQALPALLTEMGKLPPADSTAIDELAASGPFATDPAGRADAVGEGLELARWLRHRLGIKADDAVDPERYLESWGIPVVRTELPSPQLHAVACWSGDHGPAVLLNSASVRHRRDGGRRFTLAHEICHLLLDRSAALPVAEVLGGRAPGYAEKRANVFAAEFMAPAEFVGARFQERDAVDDPEKAMRSLVGRYRVSRELIAWQVRRSAHREDLLPRTWEFLKSCVHRPDRFY